MLNKTQNPVGIVYIKKFIIPWVKEKNGRISKDFFSHTRFSFLGWKFRIVEFYKLACMGIRKKNSGKNKMSSIKFIYFYYNKYHNRIVRGRTIETKTHGSPFEFYIGMYKLHTHKPSGAQACKSVRYKVKTRTRGTWNTLCKAYGVAGRSKLISKIRDNDRDTGLVSCWEA